MKYIKYLKFFLHSIIFFLIILFFWSTTFGWSYPIEDLPKIKNANYQKYRYNIKYRKIYTMLHASTYFDGRDQGIGSHAWIDIATPTWTIVSSIHSGKVILAEEKWNRWLVITIEHQQQNQKIYSTYAHLQKILVEKWDIVREWETIWLVGETGRTTGPHLHFQIETEASKEHPFFFTQCPGTIDEIINEGRCQQQMYFQTIDPILFLENNWNIWLILKNNTTNNLNKSNQNKTTNQNNSIRLSGFLWWEININDIAILKITSQNKENNEIISIQHNPDYLKIFPKQFETISETRNIFINPQKKWLTILSINQQNWKIQIPIEITDTKKIQKIQTIQIPTIFYNKSNNKNRIAILPTSKIQNKNKQIFLSNSADIKIYSIRNNRQTIKSRLTILQKNNILNYLSQKMLKQKYILIHGTITQEGSKKLFLINNKTITKQYELTPLTK